MHFGTNFKPPNVTEGVSFKDSDFLDKRNMSLLLRLASPGAKQNEKSGSDFTCPLALSYIGVGVGRLGRIGSLLAYWRLLRWSWRARGPRVLLWPMAGLSVRGPLAPYACGLHASNSLLPRWGREWWHTSTRHSGLRCHLPLFSNLNIV
jgi:hypothetical protein